MKSKLKFEKFDLWAHHYFGWRGTINSMLKYETVENPVLFEPGIEGCFISSDTGRPDRVELYKKHPWVGVFHHPHNDCREWFNINDVLNKLGRQDDFIACLPNLKGIFTVCEEQIREYKKYHQLKDIPMSMLYHPTEVYGDVFTMERFRQNKDKKIILIGDHLRKKNIFSKLKTFYRKAIIVGDESHTKADDGNIAKCRYIAVDNAEYDELLSQNIVFAEFDTVTASNTVVECMARATPILVNRRNAITEYLTYEYPLYYESAEEAQKKINNDELIECAHLYLKHHPNKHKLSLDYFHKSIFNSDVYLSL